MGTAPFRRLVVVLRDGPRHGVLRPLDLAELRGRGLVHESRLAQPNLLPDVVQLLALHQGEEPRLVELGRHHLGYGGGRNVAPRLVLELPNRQARFFSRRGSARQGEG